VRFTIESRKEEVTDSVARRLSSILRPGDVIGLVGDLGAGKTRFTQGLAAGLGVPPGCYVNSPTFTIINEYPSNPPIYHFDLYRISDPGELLEIGYYEYLDGDGICVIEWFDRHEEAAPQAYLLVEIATFGNDTRRRIEFEPHGGDWEARLRKKFRP